MSHNYEKYFTFPGRFKIVLGNTDKELSIIMTQLKNTKTKIENIKFKSEKPLMLQGTACLLDIVDCNDAAALDEVVKDFHNTWCK